MSSTASPENATVVEVTTHDVKTSRHTLWVNFRDFKRQFGIHVDTQFGFTAGQVVKVVVAKVDNNGRPIKLALAPA
ncbi:MAG TPA: hypothetical protein PL051_02275 [Candidatus Saccharibacteria bacterium]|nr:hypothetical protein [Candidatus Saccharibacteria bacterium]